MTVGELRKKLEGVLDDLPVEFADCEPLRFAEAVCGVFVLSDEKQSAADLLETERKLAGFLKRHGLGPVR